jgi:acetyltransferase-like isoleucine patch superfamily enzyme
MLIIRKILYLYSKFLKRIRGTAVLNSQIGFDSKVEPGSTFINSVLLRHSYVGYDSTIINASIGSFCSISNRVVIGGASHPLHFVSTSPVFLSHQDSVKIKYSYHEFLPVIKTNIESDVWIGEGAFVKSGIKIGTGAVIGMGAVVTKDVPAYAIVGGNPATIIRYRFKPEIIDQLLASEWWLMSGEKLSEFAPLFNNPEFFLTTLENMRE